MTARFERPSRPITRRSVLGGALAAPVIASLAACREGRGAAESPNVLFLSVDDLNSWLGCLGGHPQARTPRIDRLAADGVLFANAHTPATDCHGARTALMTGRHPTTTGVYANHDNRDAVPEGLVTLPEAFRAAGYEAMSTGKVFHHPEPDWDFEYERPDEPQRATPLNGIRRFDWGVVASTGDEDAVRWAAEMLAAPRTKPFFLGLGLSATHLPWYAPQPYFDLHPEAGVTLPTVNPGDARDLPRTARNIRFTADHRRPVAAGKWQAAVGAYLACIAYADALVGELIDALAASPHAETTIVVLSSDHGFHLGEKGCWRKFTLWEETTHVPLVISVPGGRYRGVSHRTVSLCDVAPTLFELCGLSARDPLDGESLVPLLEDPGAEWTDGVLTSRGSDSHAIRTERWRYISYGEGQEELYDRHVDPLEWRNLASEPLVADVKASLAGRLPADPAPRLPGRRTGRRRGPVEES